MGKKLYVGNLPYTLSEEDLKAVFAEAGSVESVSLITDRQTGRAKGFGFVAMSTDEEAQKAVEMLNGKEVSGRTIVVNEARPREEGRPNRSRGDFGSHNRY